MAIVLVVDDHPGMTQAVAAMVRSTGNESDTANCGTAALVVLRSRAVDLVVLDVSMPGMSGLDVLRAMASDGALARIPAVMFSASDEYRDECLRLGAKEFVLKDRADELQAVIVRYVAAPYGRQ